MGSYRQLLGMAPAGQDRKDRVQPVEEHYEGTNFPYRGTENHGVATPEGAEYDAVEADYSVDAANQVAYLPAEKETEPVAVRVVEGSARERHLVRVARVLANSTTQQLVGRLETRRSLYVQNADSVNSVYVGPDNNTTSYTGYLVGPGKEIGPFLSTEPLFVTTGNAANTAEVMAIYEYAVEL